MKGLGVKPDPLRQTARYWMGHSKQDTFGEGGQKETQSKPGTRQWRTYSRGSSRRWLFKYVLVIIMCSYLYNCHVFSQYVLQLFYIQGLIHVTDCCLFSEVKNKPWLPWVFTWIWHCRLGTVLMIMSNFFIFRLLAEIWHSNDHLSSLFTDHYSTLSYSYDPSNKVMSLL
jgi:hypothetical protein